MIVRSNGKEPMVAQREHDRPVAGLVEICDAILAGRYADVLAAAGEEVPVWAWSNLLAHGTEDDLRQAGHPSSLGSRSDSSMRWRQARAFLCGEVLAAARRGAGLQPLQSAVLVPLELQLSSGSGRTVATPEELVDVVVSAMAGLGPGGAGSSGAGGR